MNRPSFLHIILFLATCLTTLIAGSLLKGPAIFSDPSAILDGIPFSAALMTILLCHEFGHYIASKKHKVDATLPYFIPAPPVFFMIGTFGAFIKMRSPIINRRALIDIGAAGPIAGFMVSLIASAAGLFMSEIQPLPEVEGVVQMGDSLLFTFLARVILGTPPEHYDVMLHPIAFAGWVGFLVTAINLIPVGQLDGGHIAYAILGERHSTLSKGLIALMIILSVLVYPGWAFWAVLLLALGIKHPPVLYWETALDPARRRTSLVSLIIFILTFVPEPFRML